MPSKNTEDHKCSKCDVPKSCPACNSDQFTAERLDIWLMAYRALSNKDVTYSDGNAVEIYWGNQYEIDPSDVLSLCLFLSGETGE